MHIGGMGPAEELAAAVGRVVARIKETGGGKGQVPRTDVDPARTPMDPRRIEEALNVNGNITNGIYRITIDRTTIMAGHEIGNTKGVNTRAGFAGGDRKAAVDGGSVMLEDELQPALKTLRGPGINIVAIHNHMEMESPGVLFPHC